jgi:hypothetical protein
LSASSDVEISDVTAVLFLLSLFEVIFLYIEYSSAEGEYFLLNFSSDSSTEIENLNLSPSYPSTRSEEKNSLYLLTFFC